MPAGSKYRAFQSLPTYLVAPTVLGLFLACAGGGSTATTGSGAEGAASSPEPAALATTGVTLSPGTATVAAGATQMFSASVGSVLSGTVNSTGSSALAWTVDGIVNGNSSVGTIAAQAASGAQLRKAYYTASSNKQTVAVQAGDLVIVGWTVGNSPGTTTCSDSAGNTYKPIATAAYSKYAGASAYAFYTIAQGSNSALNVAVKSVNPNNLGIFVQVVAGIKPDLATALDAAASKVDSSASTSHTSAAITTTAAGDYLFTLWGQDSQSTSMAESGTGFTLLNKDSAANGHAMKFQPAAGAAQEKISTGRSVYMTSIVAAFKSASTGNSAVYTAPASGGVHTIAATSDAGTGSATVTVQSASQPAPVAVAVTPATASVLEGGTVALAATVSNSSNTSVTWTVDGITGGNGTVGTVTGSGSGAVYTAPVTAGTHTVTATSAASATAFASSSITVTAPAPAPAPITLSQSPATATVTAGGNVAITANVSGSSNTAVTWKVDGVANGNSTVGTINGSGNSITYVAPATAGSHTVVATSAANTSATGSTAVTVQSASTGTGTTSAVVMSPATPSAVGSGGTVTFAASTTGNSGDSVTWSVDGVVGGNSTVGTINGGVYTAPNSSTKALRTIKASSVATPSVSASVRILTVASNARINAKTQYGAAGNGTTDDTSAIQNAINASGSGICYVPAGTYLINPAATSNRYGLNIPSGATLLLDPAATLQVKTYSGSGGYGAVIMNTSNIALVGGTIVGDRVARNLPTYIDGSGSDYETGQGVAIGNSSTMFIVGVTSKNHCCDGFYFQNNVSNVVMSDCVADNNRRQGASLVYCHDITIQYSTFKNTNGNDPACGLDFEPNSGSTVSNVKVLNCVISGNVGGGIAGGGSLKNGPSGNGTAFCYSNTISGCTIFNNGGSNYQLGGIWWDQSSEITFSNNTIYNNKNDGIWLNYYARNYTVTGNKVTNNQGNGIFLADAAGTTVSGNTVTGNSSRQIYNADGSATVGSNITN